MLARQAIWSGQTRRAAKKVDHMRPNLMWEFVFNWLLGLGKHSFSKKWFAHHTDGQRLFLRLNVFLDCLVWRINTNANSWRSFSPRLLNNNFCAKLSQAYAGQSLPTHLANRAPIDTRLEFLSITTCLALPLSTSKIKHTAPALTNPGNAQNWIRCREHVSLGNFFDELLS